ncbi:MAG TPA: hypothetical protein VHW01_13290 [Polyangiaceae bacterium]|jgi:hypothetical protein|nr:hypothetical protein [Polyangiaceae bacterium]
MTSPEKFPRKAARIRAKTSLVKVSAAANCAINTTRCYELDPLSVQHDKRAALDAVYDGFSKAEIAA